MVVSRGPGFVKTTYYFGAGAFPYINRHRLSVAQCILKYSGACVVLPSRLTVRLPRDLVPSSTKMEFLLSVGSSKGQLPYKIVAAATLHSLVDLQ
jgi:hypothetical protein